MTENHRLLDSSIVICHFRHGGAVTDRLERLDGLYLPSIALGELYSGALRTARPAKHVELIETFLTGVKVVVPDVETAVIYGRLSAQLAAKGAPIPQNDVWIAACAMRWDLKLASTDRHFDRIEGLAWERW